MKYSSFKFKLIYVFRINDEEHKGCLKIGEATIESDKHGDLTPNSHSLNQAAKQRINQYTNTAGITYELLHTQLAMKGYKMIGDHDVHKVLTRSGIKHKFFNTSNKSNEWFKCNLETAKASIEAALDGKSALDNVLETVEIPDPIIFRPEQREAIDKAVKHFRTHKKYLWNAKMRFGKTLCALQVIKECGFKRTLIFTHRPDVIDGWSTDFNKIFFEKDSHYIFSSKRLGSELEETEKRAKNDKDLCYIYFASTQDLRGSKIVGGNHEKNDLVFGTNWDLVIIDEAHEGLQTELGKAVRDAVKSESTKELLLSGTPFNLFSEFDDDSTYTWDYVKEQKAKHDWTQNHYLDPNPYDVLPQMHILTFNLGDMLGKEGDYIDIEDKAFNFREFFRTWRGNKAEDYREMPAGAQIGDFVHEQDVNNFLNLLIRPNEENNMPFSTDANRTNFRHTLWMVPGVKEGAALAKLLKNHDVFGQFTIVNVAGEGSVDDEKSNDKALQEVRKAIGEHPEKTQTITLSCGKLTTGVNIKEWSAVLMLAGSYSTSASSYMQTIFRVQTPAEIAGRAKTDCYVFDFAPDRTLKVMSQAAQLSNKGKKKEDQQSDKALIGEFLNFCPIISYRGTQMTHYDVNSMLEHLKRVYVDRVVSRGFEDNHLYNDQLLKLEGIELKQFAHLKEIIGSTKASHKTDEIDVNTTGMTDEERDKEEKIKKKPKRERTPEEEALLAELRKKKKHRDSAISILRGISIRMPLMIYGADLKDKEEITIENFASKVDDSSWEEFMPKGVDKQLFAQFIKYYDADIFRAAGRQIRDMARASDQMPITERVKRIGQIFSSFRNPDKETVLTPWRVVNMHMSDTLGGYDFFAPDHPDTMLAEPRFVDQGEVTKNVFGAKNTRLLEINSKSGLYPLNLAYSIYRYRIDNKLEKFAGDEPTLEEQYNLWDKILRENLFVICKTEMAKSITKRTLRGFRTAKVNAKYFEDLVNQIKNKKDKFIKQIAKGNTYWNANTDNFMKFNAIVGNPPYQIVDGGGGSSSIPIYNAFVSISKAICPNYISMIMPARWYSGGKGLDEFRTETIKDKHFMILHDYVDSSVCFKNVAIEGGICYFLWSSKHNAECKVSTHLINGEIECSKRFLSNDDTDIFIRLEKVEEIILKVIKHSSFTPFSNSVFPRNYFGISSIDEKDIISKNSKEYSYNILARINNSRTWKKLRTDFSIKKTSGDIDTLANSWKVFVSKADGAAGQIGNPIPAKIIGKAELGEPKSICTETFLVVGPFKNKTQAKNVVHYMTTKFFRFCVGSRKTKNMTQDTYKFVPLQDFNEEWTDEKLYKKYGLSEDEIAYIESVIKPME
ncbi:MAG: Eco57I restriction-modification methylase domain-containing protein [Muribaculaceae bacterium]|nr:Eco57I restriction-modification methylase domain-containing protein [Muribaculaceae bacterium]